MKKQLSFLVIGLLCTGTCHAINVSSTVHSWWGYDNSTTMNGSADGFIIAGSTGKGGVHGTWDDEWGVVGVVAEKIVEHGGYFCPYQIQCANTRKKRRSWTVYYAPSGYKSSQCAWLCEPNYSGPDCKEQTATPVMCDKTLMNTKAGGKYAGLKIQTTGKDDNSKEHYITGFRQWGRDPEHDVILGVIKYMDHGVMAAPVQIKCGRDNWKEIDSFVAAVGMAPGEIKLLCAEGYKVNSSNTDCEPINPDLCNTQDMTFCAGFEKSKYNSDIHTLETVGGCVKYFCSEPGTAFTSNADTTCAPCSTGVKGGANTDDGTCVKCETGQYFDKTTNSCKNAQAFNKTDMQYGKGKTKNTNPDIEKQCWTKIMPSEFIECVTGKKATEQTVNRRSFFVFIIIVHNKNAPFGAFGFVNYSLTNR